MRERDLEREIERERDYSTAVAMEGGGDGRWRRRLQSKIDRQQRLGLGNKALNWIRRN